jgi:hypothetical protein
MRICRQLPPSDEGVLHDARVTPYFNKVFTARQNLADNCAKSRKPESATSNRTSCEMLRAMLRIVTNAGAADVASRVHHLLLTLLPRHC